jgi:hypothetical protein
VLTPAKECQETGADGSAKTPTSRNQKEKSQTPKRVHKEAKKGGVDCGLKKASPAGENSNPYSMEFAEEGLVDALTIAKDAEPAEVGVSAVVKTKQPTSPMKTDAGRLTSEKDPRKVMSDSKDRGPSTFTRFGRLQLLIFNVHGTLLDCSMKVEKNPNTSIRSSIKTATRRVVFRPWLMEFLSRCFKYFVVAFLGSKSESYVQEIVPAMLAGMQGEAQQAPLFVWSSIECEAVDFQEGSPVAWGKPLEKVFKNWPCWNYSNTLIIDHRANRVRCNPPMNVLIPQPFYVEQLYRIGDDCTYLKSCFWALLQRLFPYHDIMKFMLSDSSNMTNAGLEIPNVLGRSQTDVIGLQLEGEGT